MLKKRLRSVELAQAKRNGDLDNKVVVILDGETDADARVRSGIDRPGAVIFISEIDAKL